MTDIPTETVERSEEMLNIWVDVAKCARCGGNHVHLMFSRFSGTPPEEYTHHAKCPETGEPVLYRIEHTPEGVATVVGGTHGD